MKPFKGPSIALLPGIWKWFYEAVQGSFYSSFTRLYGSGSMVTVELSRLLNKNI